jgi:hypothetical protein
LSGHVIPHVLQHVMQRGDPRLPIFLGVVDDLRAALGASHRRYNRWFSFRERWRIHLLQDRFASYLIDNAHLMVTLAEDQPWSGAFVNRRSSYGR